MLTGFLNLGRGGVQDCALETERRVDLPSQYDICAPPLYQGSTCAFEIDPLTDSRWSDFVVRHPKASAFHTRNWLSALRSVHGYQPAALCTSAPGDPLTCGLVFCPVESWITGNRLVSLPFSDHCEPLVNSPDELDLLLQRMKNRIRNKNRTYIEIRPLTLMPGESTGFKKTYSCFLHTIDLAKSSQALFRTFHKDCVQRKIRRAEREALKYMSGNSEELLASFYQLLLITRRRQGLVPQPFSWFCQLSRNFGSELQIRLVSYAGKPVASILTLKHGQTLVYKYGCSDAAFHNLGGMALLFWRAIQEAQTEGITQFELGRSDPENAGLVTFKEHWGAQRALINYWRFQCNAGSRHLWSGRPLRKIVSVAPNWSLAAAGKLLYRHIG